MKHINSFLLIIFLIQSLVGQVENWERKASIMDKESVIPVRFVPMVHLEKPIPE